jgi:aldose sugar dehydrogenase
MRLPSIDSLTPRRTPVAPTALGALLLLGTACGAQAQDAAIHHAEDHAFRVVTVAEGLNNPWSIAFLPSGEMLVTERPGRLRVLRNGTLDPESVGGVPSVWANGQGGLLDVVPHPDFANNRLLYLSFSKPNEDASEATTAVVRGVFDGQNLTEVEEIFEAVAWRGAGQHFGSRLAFDQAGYLFITVGDRGNSPMTDEPELHASQRLDNHMGSVIRLHDDGRIPADNPFIGVDGALPEIYSYGHRNPQGLVIRHSDNTVWVNEHGPQGGDEVNLVEPGKNYGWPVVGLGVQYGGAQIHDATSGTGYTDPVHAWVPSIATSGKALYAGNAFPAWQGSMFVGGLAGEQLARLTFDGTQVTGEEILLQGVVGRIRDVRVGPDGFIYLAIDDRRGGPTPIVRLEPVAH